MRKLIKRRFVAKIIGVCPRQITNLIGKDNFPDPIKVGETDSWVESEVIDWIEKKLADRKSVGGAV